MKRISIILFLVVFSSLSLWAQSLQMYNSKYYRMYTDIDKASAEKMTSIMDSYVSFFNKYLHFDIDNLSTKLKIRLYRTKSSYDAYLSSIISKTSDNYVFLQYKDVSKNELVAYTLSDQKKMEKDLIHYGFVQFMKAFIPYPPLWLMNGFAVYFEKTTYSTDKKEIVFKENYDWILTLKNVVTEGKTIPIDTLLILDLPEADKNINTFYAQTWGLIDFLINSKYLDYNRLLWDSLSALRSSATRQENDALVIAKAFKWIDKKTFVADFISYVHTLKTFSDLVKEGTEEYAKGGYDAAEKNFISAMSIDDTDETPYYYLGLINYARGDYSAAEYYYHTALQITDDKDRINYALAVNAFADNRFEDARFYIQSISAKGKETYKNSLKTLSLRMEKAK